jgi:hypothetical protein
MPVALSTRFTTWVSLPLELDLPDEIRPAFEVRFISDIQAKELDQQWRPREKERAVDYQARMIAFLAPLVISTRNFGIEPSPAGAEALGHLVLGELQDLAGEIYKAGTLGYEELKKSKSQQGLVPATSAGSVADPVATNPT